VSPPERDHSDPGEGRLSDYLEELRDDPPQSDPALGRSISRHARWQQAVRAPLHVVGILAAALVDGVAGVLGARRTDGR
jgi:hypothetical protein